MFSEEDIKLRITTTNFFIHQYAQVKVDEQWIDIDLYGATYGIPFGKHAFMFK